MEKVVMIKNSDGLYIYGTDKGRLISSLEWAVSRCQGEIGDVEDMSHYPRFTNPVWCEQCGQWNEEEDTHQAGYDYNKRVCTTCKGDE